MNLLHSDKKFGFVLVTDPQISAGAWLVLGSGIIKVGKVATPSVTTPSSSTTHEIKSLEGVLYDPQQINQTMSLAPVPVSAAGQQPGDLLNTVSANGGIIAIPVPDYAPLYFKAGSSTYQISQLGVNHPGSGQNLVDIANSQNSAHVRLSVFPLNE